MNLKEIFGYDVAEAMDKKDSCPTKTEVTEKNQLQSKKPSQSEKNAQSKKCPVTIIDREEAFSDSEVDLSDASTIRELMRAEDCYNDWLDRGEVLVRIGKNHFPDEKSIISTDFYYWTRLLSTVLDSAPASIFTDEVLTNTAKTIAKTPKKPAESAKTTKKSPTTPTKTTAYPKATSIPDAPTDEYVGKHVKK